MEVRVRDPVHNFITLREKQAKLLGTRAIQRLRGIRQLALANLLYPGALHTRFDSHPRRHPRGGPDGWFAGPGS